VRYAGFKVGDLVRPTLLAPKLVALITKIEMVERSFKHPMPFRYYYCLVLGLETPWEYKTTANYLERI
jgi:hypothetical protein